MGELSNFPKTTGLLKKFLNKVNPRQASKAGKIVKKFTTRDGQTAIIRYPKMEDLDEITDYINELSKEDTYILFSGETVTKEEEAEYLEKVLKEIETRDKVVLFCEIDRKIVANGEIGRNKHNKKRSLHVGHFGISVRKQYRGVGVGGETIRTLIKEAKKEIKGLKAIALEVFSNNNIACTFYQSIGFKEVGRIPGKILHRSQYVDEVHMYMPI